MSSECVSSDRENGLHDPTPRTSSPISPSWWSDSDGRRSARDSRLDHDNGDSPWWESECETKEECTVTPDLSPSKSINDTSTSSVTPPWWSEPSSRQLSTSATEVEAESVDRAPNQQLEDNTERRLGRDDTDGAWLQSLNTRKRSREQSHILSNSMTEPPTDKLKLEPLSPHANPDSVLESLKRGICQPLKSFLLFFTVDLLTRVCDITNTYGWEVVLDNPSLASEDGSWEEITVREMYLFIAVVLIMRHHGDVGFGSFWRDQAGQMNHWPNVLMKRSRFLTILQVLRFSETVEKEVPNNECNNENQKQISQNSRDEMQFSKSGSLLIKEFRHFFDEARKVFKVFPHQCEVLCMEEMSSKIANSRRLFWNYMKINLPPLVDEKSSTRTKELCMENDKSENSNSDPMPCGKITVAPDNINTSHHKDDSELKNELKFFDEQSASELTGGGSVQDTTFDATFFQLQSEKCNEDGTKQTHPSTTFSITWENNCLNVSAVKDSFNNQIAQLSYSGDEKQERKSVLNCWQEVFIPCSEVVYKNWPCGGASQDGADALLERTHHHSVGRKLDRSFFYYYLHLAICFSTVSDIQCSPVGSRCNGGVMDEGLWEQVVDGLILLGKPDRILQSDSESDSREMDGACDSSTSDQNDDEDDNDNDNDNDTEDGNDGRRPKPHKYVQARGRVSCKCALCWSLHQEVRRVHTRCTRCGLYFCLSRFRNCMEEAHGDKEIMNQIWDEEIGDVSGVSHP